MLSVIFLLFLALISFAVGRRILSLCKVRFNNLLEESVFSIGIGLGLVSYLTLTIGLMGILYKWTCLLLLALLFCLALWEIWKLRGILQNITQKLNARILLKRENFFEWGLLVILPIYVLLCLIASFAPPTDWDSAVYHLAIPKLWIQHHKVVYIPYIMTSEFPLTIETLYTLGMILTDDTSASLIIWMFGVLFILTILSFCRRYLSAKVGLLAGVAFCGTPLFSKLAIGTLVELAIGYYAFLGFYAFLNYLDKDDNKMLMLSGVTGGFAAASKHTGLVPFAVLFIGVIIVEIKRRRLSIASLRHIVLFGLVFLMIPAPWYIKSYINTGNPTVMYLTKLFGGRNLLPEDMSNMIMSWRDRQGFKPGLTAYLITPLKILWRSFFSDSFFWIAGVFFLAFAPCLVLIKKSKAIKYSLAYSAGVLIMYSIVTNQPRLVIPIFAGLFIAGAYSAYWLLDNCKPLRKIVQAVILVSFLLNIVPIARATSIRLPVVMGLETREEYLDTWTGIYNVIEFANHHLSDDVKILIIDPRGYYFDKPYITGLRVCQGFIRYDGIRNVSQLMEMFKSYGITHLFINRGFSWGVPFLDELRHHMTLIYYYKNGYLFRLNYEYKEGRTEAKG